MEPGDTETFQMEYHEGKENQITFLSKNKKYWTAGKTITASSDKVSTSDSTAKIRFKVEC